VALIDGVPLLLACSITAQLFSISEPWHTMQWWHYFLPIESEVSPAAKNPDFA
jgi:hypothetical protein